MFVWMYLVVWGLAGVTVDRPVLLLMADHQWGCQIHTCEGQTAVDRSPHLLVCFFDTRSLIGAGACRFG